MLPRWHKRLRILVTQNEVTLMEISGVLRKRATKHQVVNVDRMHASDGPACLTALGFAVRKEKWQGWSAEVVLGGHLASYTLVPWSEQLSNRQERLAFLSHCFYQAFGEPSRHWDLRMSRPIHHAHSLASGIDIALLDGLKSVLKEAGIRIRSIYPSLMIKANQSRHLLSRGTTWFAVMESGLLNLALLCHGRWMSVSCYEAESDSPEKLAGLLERFIARESVLIGKLDQHWPLVLHSDRPIDPSVFSRKTNVVKKRGEDGFQIAEGAPYQLLSGV